MVSNTAHPPRGTISRMLEAPFIAELSRRGTSPPADLASRLEALLQAARVAWPGVDLDADAFVAYLAERWPPQSLLDEWLASVHASDLYLACACAQGSTSAIAAFDRVHVGAVRDFLARSKPDDAFVEDVRQTLREKLFVGPAGKIREYSGRGALGGWVRALAVHTAIDLRRRRGERLPDLRDQQAAAIDPELGYLAERYRGEVEGAFRQALAALDSEQRTLMRMHFVDGITLDELARLKKVHRATIARHLATARRAILEETRQRLRERFSLSTDELNSLVGMVRSQLNISIARLLNQ
jgi:RNA polymerase sigma-70 factor (ECF subfamily)